ncbi:hypothetical protein CRUP_008007 [Coryphaenoides rupestris]|nr:hypothetical protein CRUP_008007 [Coryphaenoides rupestris]
MQHTGLQMIMAHLLLSCLGESGPSDPNYFFYEDFLNGNGNGEIHFSGVKLYVDTEPQTVLPVRGGNATLPCRYWYDPELSTPRRVRVKWSWLPVAGGQEEEDVLVAIGPRSRSFGNFRGRVHLRQDFLGDATLMMSGLQLNESGRYRCEVVDGLEDRSAVVEVELRGVVFPYQPPHGRYHLNYQGARQVCQEQDSTLATFDQLLQSWKEGLNWCNAGWLADGTVQYPITQPRAPCGGHDVAPGVRTYGRRHHHKHRYDVFCFSSSIRGEVYYLPHAAKLNLSEAEEACRHDGAQIAKVGQLYAAWKFTDLDRCDAGWLSDGSLRYPIITPRKNCGSSEPGVRSFGFPPPQHKHGVYCYKSAE